jgi:hypothetical protein
LIDEMSELKRSVMNGGGERENMNSHDMIMTGGRKMT